jgi:class 3 adenylate cyclase
MRWLDALPFAAVFERRFFLVVDVGGSTAIAERLGALEAHRLLAAVFLAVAEPVELCRGEIYQSVGDEIVQCEGDASPCGSRPPSGQKRSHTEVPSPGAAPLSGRAMYLPASTSAARARSPPQWQI